MCSKIVGRHKNRKSEAKDNPRHISRYIGERQRYKRGLNTENWLSAAEP